MRHELEKKILMNHIELQDKAIREIVNGAVADYNMQASLHADANARFLSERDLEYYIEKEARRTHAREVLDRIARTLGVKVKYDYCELTTTVDGETKTLTYLGADVDDEEV